MLRIKSYEDAIKKNFIENSPELVKQLKTIFKYNLYSKTELLDFVIFKQPFTLNIMIYSMDRGANEVFNDKTSKDIFSGSKDIIEELEFFIADDNLEDKFWDFYDENEETLSEIEDKVIFDWFISCWEQAEGSYFKFPSYFSFHDDIRSYDLQKGEWIDDEDKWNE